MHTAWVEDDPLNNSVSQQISKTIWVCMFPSIYLTVPHSYQVPHIAHSSLKDTKFNKNRKSSSKKTKQMGRR